jgi:transcriptional regulator with XRE-family HTH domain
MKTTKGSRGPRQTAAPDRTAFGNRLRSARQMRGVTADDIHYALGVSRNTLSYLENGKRDPSLDVVRRLAAHLNVNLDWLVNGTGHPDA